MLDPSQCMSVAARDMSPRSHLKKSQSFPEEELMMLHRDSSAPITQTVCAIPARLLMRAQDFPTQLIPSVDTFKRK